ncbi:MarR family transcriptional regulator [Natronolimnohabitans sp. A-GB9]|uniref:helix-turn-helix transcriptional regulator n=1 Tax=Natronolimnohabitans sp. A-GB9 TaxID=3069757 RepID=UPI0027B4EFB8|nr:MarR family transcriptional regulator [Natronolimnohabitans sp. A-GB9]MDQ2051480.1 MarR family transcriptional regulator [Natronolimnohabitans sp. A-GB9]
MVPTSQIGVYVPFASIHSSVSIDATEAIARRLDTHAVGTTLEVGDRSAVVEIVPGTSLLGLTSTVEVALIAVLFLLIGGLVAIRIADELSDRDVELTTLSLRPAATAESSETESDHDSETNGSPTHADQAFEHYISPDTPSELLSDEGEVVRLLVENHGRLRQHRIADETGWSKSKVSRICSQMDSDDMIEKASVGRENVITLSDRSADDSSQSHDAENPLP